MNYLTAKELDQIVEDAKTERSAMVAQLVSDLSTKASNFFKSVLDAKRKQMLESQLGARHAA